jgi:threonine/homoserine/homoserine lactone efflux protein
MLLNFICATALITVLPGPSLILIVAQSLRHGVASGLWVVGGVVLADAILLLAVCGGLGAMLLAAVWMMSVLKWLGIAWLAWLGLGLLRSAAQPAPVVGLPADKAFRQGLLTTLSNPKIIGFLLVYFPQFLQHGQPVLAQMVLLAPLFLLTVAGVFALCALLARRFQRLLNSPSAQVCLQRVSGMSLLGCALVSTLQ